MEFDLFKIANAESGITEEVQSVMLRINEHILNPIIYLLIAVATIYFLYGLMNFVANSDNEEERSKGKKHMIWGLIGMLIMFTVFAIMRIIAGTIGVPADQAQMIP